MKTKIPTAPAPHPMSYDQAKQAVRDPGFSSLKLYIWGELQVEGKNYVVDYKRGLIRIGAPPNKAKKK